MPAIKETIITKSGAIFERMIFARDRKVGEVRRAKTEPTVEAVERVNQRNSLRSLEIKVHDNFKPGDHWLVLSYEGEEPSKAEAKKEIKRFLDKLRRKRKAAGRLFKWILVTEYENKRIHHHLLINNVGDFDELFGLWGNGLIRNTPLDDSGDWRQLCEYMHKETAKTFRDVDSPSRLRYSCSRNLSMPNVYREEISAADILDEPQAEKGYYIVSDSIFRGENPFTGKPYVEYVMLPLDKPRKRYNNREKRRYRNEIHDTWLRNHASRQLEIDYPF